MRQIIFTKDGFEKLKKRKEELLVKRKETIESLKRAREMGDLSENGLYKAAKFELGNIDRELRQTQFFLEHADVRTRSLSKTIEVGSKIVLGENGKETQYLIVGEYESNPLEQRLSYKSPIGRALIGKSVGDIVHVVTPRGPSSFVIKKVS